MANLSKLHVVFSSSTLIRLDKDAFEGHLCQTVNNFVKQNKSSLLPPLRKRIFKHVIRNNLTSQMLLTFATLNTLSFREIEKVKISHIYDLAE